MISYHNDLNCLENSFVNVDFADSSELGNIIQDIHIMCNAVINCIAVKYIDEEWQEKFTDILREQIADMLYEYKSDLQEFKQFMGQE